MKLKSLPIAMQLWIIYSFVAAAVIACLCLLPFIINSFFNKQIFDLLLDAQKNLSVIPIGQIDSIDPSQATATVSVTGLTSANMGSQPMAISFGPISSVSPTTQANAIVLASTNVGGSISTSEIDSTTSSMPLVSHSFFSNNPDSIALPQIFRDDIWNNANKQTNRQQTYSNSAHNKTLLYAVKKMGKANGGGYLVSYAWSTYSSGLTSTLLIRLIPLMLAIIALILLPGMWFARSITKPLKALEKHSELVAQENLTQPIELNRNDEIGRLADKFNDMRIQLAEQELARQEYLQNITHDLRTPLMVIRSYAESITDGINPAGSAEDSARIIAKESDAMIEKVNNIVLLNRLNFLRTLDEKAFTEQHLDEIIDSTANRIQCLRNDLQLHITTQPTVVLGDEEQLSILLGNVLENMVRYAKEIISIDLQCLTDENDQPYFILKMSNDGPPFECENLQELFEPFRKGPEGKFGLGLSIARKIALYHDFTISAENLPDGALISLTGITVSSEAAPLPE